MDESDLHLDDGFDDDDEACIPEALLGRRPIKEEDSLADNYEFQHFMIRYERTQNPDD